MLIIEAVRARRQAVREHRALAASSAIKQGREL
jgi:hypothetical protein